MKNTFRQIRAGIFAAVLLLSASAPELRAQELSLPEADRQTYEAYLASDWKTLIEKGKEAHKAGIDFYYLQVRMGIAYYEQGKYMQSVSYFEKSYAADPKNSLVAEYLYYAYLFSGRYKDAQYFAEKMSPEFRTKNKISSLSVLSSLLVFGKTDLPESHSFSGDYETLSQKEISKSNIGGVGLGFDSFSRNSLYAGASFLNLQANIYEYGDTLLPEEFTEGNNQFDAYLSYLRHFKKGNSLQITGHLFAGKTYADHEILSGSGRRLISNRLYETPYSAFWGGAYWHKRFGRMKLGGGLAVSNLNYYKTFEKKAYFLFFPTGNLKLYTLSYFEQNSVKDSLQALKNYAALKQTVGFGFGSNITLEAGYTFGERYLFSDLEGIVVNNHSEPTANIFNFTLYFRNTKNTFNLFLSYTRETKTNSFILNLEQNSLNYINQSITGGLSWYFLK